MFRSRIISTSTKLESTSKSTLGWMMKGFNRFFVSESKHFKDQAASPIVTGKKKK